MISGAVLNHGASLIVPGQIALPVACADLAGGQLCQLAKTYGGRVTGAGVNVPVNLTGGGVSGKSLSVRAVSNPHPIRAGRYKLTVTVTVKNITPKPPEDELE
jgi:hypothetical protein